MSQDLKMPASLVKKMSQGCEIFREFSFGLTATADFDLSRSVGWSCVIILEGPNESYQDTNAIESTIE